MKKLILLGLAAAGVAVLAKSKSAQIKAGASKVTSDPRVQSALATASEKTGPLAERAAPYAGAVKDKVAEAAERLRPAEPTTSEPAPGTPGTASAPAAAPATGGVAPEPVAEPTPAASGDTAGDPLTDPAGASEPAPAPDPLTDPLSDPLTDPLPPQRPSDS